jgi:transcriptional regulator GlxA family with amidase domain
MVEKAVRYIETNYESIHSVRQVAENIGVSYESLRKRFARSVGMPMQSFLSLVRVRKAQEWYGTTDKKLYAVARDVGFPDDAALRRQWKRHVGRNPRESRALLIESAGVVQRPHERSGRYLQDRAPVPNER